MISFCQFSAFQAVFSDLFFNKWNFLRVRDFLYHMYPYLFYLIQITCWNTGWKTTTSVDWDKNAWECPCKQTTTNSFKYRKARVSKALNGNETQLHWPNSKTFVANFQATISIVNSGLKRPSTHTLHSKFFSRPPGLQEGRRDILLVF
jgi:hypothetical protein